MTPLLTTVLLACRDASAPPSEQCLDGYGDACVEAAIEASNVQERNRYENRGQGLHEPLSDFYIRDEGGYSWASVDSTGPGFLAALHTYGVWCSRGKVAACYEVGNWLAYDFASPAAAVRPYQVACDANFEDACFRAKQARIAADQHLNKPMPRIDVR